MHDTINLFSPRFHFHTMRNEWWSIFLIGHSHVELIVRTSYGVPHDSFYRVRKVSQYVKQVPN